jgi:hypothetical protein
MLLLILAAAGILTGLFVAAAAFLTAGSIYSAWKKGRGRARPGANPRDAAYWAAKYFARWSVFDGALLLLLTIGLLFLFTDLIAVWRDRAGFPAYRFGYTLCGFVFVLTGILFMLVRQTALLYTRASLESPLPDDHAEPDRADESKEGIQR